MQTLGIPDAYSRQPENKDRTRDSIGDQFVDNSSTTTISTEQQMTDLGGGGGSIG